MIYNEFLPTISYYFLWWGIRTFLILFIFPLIFYKGNYKNNFHKGLLFLTICLPVSWSMAYLEGLAGNIFVILEIVLVIMLAENLLVFEWAKKEQNYLSIYLTAMFLISTLPLFMHYLYLDVFLVKSNLLNWLNSFIIVYIKQKNAVTQDFIFIIYPLVLYTVLWGSKKTYQKIIDNELFIFKNKDTER